MNSRSRLFFLLVVGMVLSASAQGGNDGGPPGGNDGGPPGGNDGGAGGGNDGGAGGGNGTRTCEDTNPGAGETFSSGGVCLTGPDDGQLCHTNGSSMRVDYSGLRYNAMTGMFMGTFQHNTCPGHEFEEPLQASCRNRSFPVANYGPQDLPKGAPARGDVGVSLEGVRIYGPFEAGFTVDQVCTSGSCDAGLDIIACEHQLEATCTGPINEFMLPKECGGHACPYHYHFDLDCNYNVSLEMEHSPLIGIALDGRGIYGKFENQNGEPMLDACNGHYGRVPPNGMVGVPMTSDMVYHYHTTDVQPFTIGCFGPANITECRDLYSECDLENIQCYMFDFDDGNGPVATAYFPDCPCFNDAGSNVPPNLVYNCTEIMMRDDGNTQGGGGDRPTGLPEEFDHDMALESEQLMLTWPEVGALRRRGMAETGGLGRLMTMGTFEVWMCTECEDEECAMPHSYLRGMGLQDMICWVYHEGMGFWLPWGLNSDLRLCPVEDNGNDGRDPGGSNDDNRNPNGSGSGDNDGGSGGDPSSSGGGDPSGSGSASAPPPVPAK